MQIIGRRLLCQGTQQYRDLYLQLHLKPPRTRDGVTRTYLLWLEPPKSPEGCAEGQQLLFPCLHPNGCWGGSLIKPHSPTLSQTEQVNSTPPALVLCIKPNYMSFVQGELDFLTGTFEHFCHFHIHHTRGFNHRIHSSPTPYKYTLSTH